MSTTMMSIIFLIACINCKAAASDMAMSLAVAYCTHLSLILLRFACHFSRELVRFVEKKRSTTSN
ncbi:hypothetical protein T4B_13583 [Trichinella pseudospiralis]|uniref:Uncharacterized protein n=1 Tax=Trichinella pseudospiralis TaxID=6337 RepID=A0A0V1IRA0_TRIPS|nr:hypothetical protein T4B_13583 [Trichinella pseudospiralis]